MTLNTPLFGAIGVRKLKINSYASVLCQKLYLEHFEEKATEYQDHKPLVKKLIKENCLSHKDSNCFLP